MKRLKKCIVCSKYTLEQECHGVQTKNPHPARFDPAQKKSRYRRMSRGLEV